MDIGKFVVIFSQGENKDYRKNAYSKLILLALNPIRIRDKVRSKTVKV